MGDNTNKTNAAKARRKNARQAPISAPPRSQQQRTMSVSQRQMVQRRLRERAASQSSPRNEAAPTPEATTTTAVPTPPEVDATVATPSTTPASRDATAQPERRPTAASAPIARHVPAIETDEASGAGALSDTGRYAPIDVEGAQLQATQERPTIAAEAEAGIEAAEQPIAIEADSAGGHAPSIGKRYVRKRTPHLTQMPIDDLAPDDTSVGSYTHDSNVAVGGMTPLSGMVYRRSRSNMPAFQRKLQYGQYLEIPKGRRAIFASRERAQRRRSVLSLIVVIVLLAIAAVLIASLMRDAIANMG